MNKSRHISVLAKEAHSLLKQVKLVPAVRLKATAVPATKRDYYQGDQRFLTQYLVNAFSQEDPNIAFHDVSRGDHDFSSCDYLALAQNKELNAIEADYIREHGRITFNR